MMWLWIAMASVAVWLLTVHSYKSDEVYWNEVGSVCDECFSKCERGERLCAACRKVKRAKELQKENE